MCLPTGSADFIGVAMYSNSICQEEVYNGTEVDFVYDTDAACSQGYCAYLILLEF